MAVSSRVFVDASYDHDDDEDDGGDGVRDDGALRMGTRKKEREIKREKEIHTVDDIPQKVCPHGEYHALWMLLSQCRVLEIRERMLFAAKQKLPWRILGARRSCLV